MFSSIFYYHFFSLRPFFISVFSQTSPNVSARPFYPGPKTRISLFFCGIWIYDLRPAESFMSFVPNIVRPRFWGEFVRKMAFGAYAELLSSPRDSFRKKSTRFSMWSWVIDLLATYLPHGLSYGANHSIKLGKRTGRKFEKSAGKSIFDTFLFLTHT